MVTGDEGLLHRSPIIWRTPRQRRGERTERPVNLPEQAGATFTSDNCYSVNFTTYSRHAHVTSFKHGFHSVHPHAWGGK